MKTVSRSPYRKNKFGFFYVPVFSISSFYKDRITRRDHFEKVIQNDKSDRVDSRVERSHR